MSAGIRLTRTVRVHFAGIGDKSISLKSGSRNIFRTRLPTHRKPQSKQTLEVASMRGNELPGEDGKYLLLNLESRRVIFGEPHEKDEFFVLMLRDRFTQGALRGYAAEVRKYAEELRRADTYRIDSKSGSLPGLDRYADWVSELAERAGPDNPWCKTPD